MSAAERTRPANEIPSDEELLERQKKLTYELYDHPDPHVRLMAHMSERQLGLVEMFMGVRADLQKLSETVAANTEIVREIGGRLEVVERKHNNGGGHQLDLPLHNS